MALTPAIWARLDAFLHRHAGPGGT
jgi:hypothetical protein